MSLPTADAPMTPVVPTTSLDLARLRICLIAGTLGQGGAERQLFYMAKTLRQCGAEVRVLSLTRGEFWESRLRDLGVVVTWVGQSASRLARMIEIIRQLRRHPADIVQSQHFYTNLYAVVAARVLGLPEIGAVRNDALSEVREHRVLGGLSLRMPRVLAANSRAGVANAIALGVAPGRVRLLPNVVDCEAFQPAPRDYAREVVRLLAAGRFTEQKRFDRFLSILAAVRSVCGGHVKGLIVGQGQGEDGDAHRDWLTSTAEGLGLPSTAIEFRSRTPNMLALYQECDVFVLSSDWEGTPNVVLEAMASGVPVVATRVGGVPELVQHGVSGFHAEPADEDGLVRAVCRLVREPLLRQTVAEEARKHVENQRSLARLGHSLTDVYMAALGMVGENGWATVGIKSLRAEP